MNIWEIKNKNKLVFAIDYQYKKLLIYICKQELQLFPGVPLTYEDLYYEFLSEVHEHVNNFDQSKDFDFKNYITLKCKYSCKKKLRKYWTNDFIVMNSYVEWNDDIAAVNDVTINEEKFNLSLLTKEELEFFQLRFVKGLQIGQTCKKLNISRYMANQLLKSIVQKVKSNQKN